MATEDAALVHSVDPPGRTEQRAARLSAPAAVAARGGRTSTAYGVTPAGPRRALPPCLPRRRSTTSRSWSPTRPNRRCRVSSATTIRCGTARSLRCRVTGDGQHVLLHFGAVDQIATVWVNNQQVAYHEGGYTEFSADITSALRTSGTAGTDGAGRGPQRKQRVPGRQAAQRSRRALLHRSIRHLADGVDGAGAGHAPSTSSTSRRI